MPLVRGAAVHGAQARRLLYRPAKKHWWQHLQTVIEAPEYGIQGGIDALFNIGAPQLMVTELKTLNPAEFDNHRDALP